LREFCANSKALKQGGTMAGKLRKGRRNTGSCLQLFQWDWIKTIPYEVRDCAICDLVKACKNYFWQVTTKPPLDFRTKKVKQQSIVVRERDWMKKNGMYSFLKEICTSEHTAADLNGFDSRLIRTN
jgi:hypothetical protein